MRSPYHSTKRIKYDLRFILVVETLAKQARFLTINSQRQLTMLYYTENYNKRKKGKMKILTNKLCDRVDLLDAKT